MVVLVVAAVALLAAAAVVLLAIAEAPRRDGRRPPIRAFRRGLRAWLRPDRELRAEARAAAAAPVDVTLDQMLRANVERGAGYLQPGELAGSFHEAAVRVLPGRGRSSADRERSGYVGR